MRDPRTSDPITTPSHGRGAGFARAHGLYLRLRLMAALGIGCSAAAHVYASGALGARDLVVLASAAAWPLVMWAAIVLGRRTRAADRVVVLDALPLSIIIAAGGIFPYGVLFFVALFNATSVLGATGLGGAALLIGVMLGSSHAAGLLIVEQPGGQWYVTAIPALWTCLYLIAAALTAHQTRRELKETRDALDRLRRELEQRVEERTAKLAAVNRAIVRFVPSEFLASLGHEDVTTLQLGDAISREVTILFADVRGFTTRAERLAPDETFAFLNELLGRLGPVIRANHGFVDKYIGDAIMALFLDDPADAVRAAVAMQRACAAAADETPGSPAIQIGVGIHHGTVRMGLIGEVDRIEATVISDAVNTCARVEALTKSLGAGIVVTGEVAARLPDALREDSRSLGVSPLRGRVRHVELVEVFAHEDEALRARKRNTRARLAEAIAAYEAGQPVVARDLLRELSAASPDDRALASWTARASERVERPDAPDR